MFYNYYRRLKWQQLIFFAAFIMFTSACKKIDIFEKTKPFPKHEWGAAEKLPFSFDINDTQSRYNIFFVLRHTEGYHFNNIWVNVTTILPGDTAQTIRANIKLGDNTQWLGSAMGDVIEHRVRLNDYPVKLKAGTYNFMLQEIMREDPLTNILNAGVRVERATEQ